MKIIHLKSIDSTHLYALRLIGKSVSNLSHKKLLNEDIAIFSDEQTNGIGRGKHQWISQRGNLFASVIMKKPEKFRSVSDSFEKNKRSENFKNFENSELGLLSLTSACAVRDSILEFSHYIDKEKLKLHWPNDIYYYDQNEQKKLSGILLALLNDFLVISVGINIISSPNLGSLAEHASISIRDIIDSSQNKRSDCEKNVINAVSEIHSNLSLQPGVLLCIVLTNIKKWILHLIDKGFSEIRSYWLENINDINCDIMVRNGDSVFVGKFVDIDNIGRAVLKNKEKTLLISSGDLFECKKI